MFAAFVFAFVVALLLGGILAAIFGRTRGVDAFWTSFVFFFLIILLTTWVFGLWIAPFGPLIGDVAWVPFVVVGIIIALIIAAVAPTAPQRRPSTPEEAEDQQAVATLFGTFFWILVVVLSIALAFRFF